MTCLHCLIREFSFPYFDADSRRPQNVLKFQEPDPLRKLLHGARRNFQTKINS